MQNSIRPSTDPAVRYLLRLADTCLILSHRISEWSGHAPIIEEDIALSNMALDLIGQTRGVLTLAGSMAGQSFDEDQLAYLRDERDYFNPTLVELPRGDFAFTVMRNAMTSAFLKLLWERLLQSSNTELAAIAGKAVKEARYHLQHAGDWVVRLGGGTQQSQQRLAKALEELWRYHVELFEADAVDAHATQLGLGPSWADLKEPWMSQMKALLDQADLSIPADSIYKSTGKQGRHSEHMGYILAEMQHMQRSYPGGVW
jgi:ring-1,2-phenylacetyl-CoA epoxidase subunit PaaC